MNKTTEPTKAAEPVSGVEIFVPLNKLKKSPRNARKVPHGEAAIEALAASIHHKGMLQNLVIEPELEDGQPTGFYFVTAGEGRRLAQLLRAKRKQIKRSHPIRCYIDTENDAAELSLDENVTRTAMHPADQFERFRELSESKGWGAEEIGARFGVSPEIVKRRLRLGAVSPKLMDIYRQDGLTLDQLSAFAITDDHARQEQVFANLSYNKEPWIIRRDLTADKVPATDRRARFIGTDAYVDAGGTIMRDLFTEDGGGFFEDAALLDTMVMEKLREVAGEVQAEGWKWAEASIDFPHDHGMRRFYPQAVALSEEDETRLCAASTEYDSLIEGYDAFDDMPAEVAAKVQALDTEIDTLSAKRSAYDPEVIMRGGVIVSLGSQGQVRVEKGFVREEDKPRPEAGEDPETSEGGGLAGSHGGTDEPDEDGGAGKPLSDTLVRDLTAHRTLALRLALGEQPEVALVALTRNMVAQFFYGGFASSCLDFTARSDGLASHAEGIADTKASEALTERHERLGAGLPSDVDGLFGHIAALSAEERMALLAHCVALTVNAVKLPWETSSQRIEAANELADAVKLDMRTTWTPTARAYFARVTKAQIMEAVSEAVSAEAAERIGSFKKPDMAEAAENLVQPTTWLPAVLRTRGVKTVLAKSEAESGSSDAEAAEPDGIGTSSQTDARASEQPSEAEAHNTEAEDGAADQSGLAPWEEESATLAIAAE